MYALILEGAQQGYWEFADQAQGQRLLQEYLAVRNGEIRPRLPRKVPRADRRPRLVQCQGGLECLNLSKGTRKQHA